MAAATVVADRAVSKDGKEEVLVKRAELYRTVMTVA